MKFSILVLATSLMTPSVFAASTQPAAPGLIQMSRQNASAEAIRLAVKQYKLDSGREMKLVNLTTTELKILSGDDTTLEIPAPTHYLHEKLAQVTYQINLEAQSVNVRSGEMSNGTVTVTAVLNCTIEHFNTPQHVGTHSGMRTDCQKESIDFGVEKGD